jgi:hypothetical protein
VTHSLITICSLTSGHFLKLRSLKLLLFRFRVSSLTCNFLAISLSSLPYFESDDDFFLRKRLTLFVKLNVRFNSYSLTRPLFVLLLWTSPLLGFCLFSNHCLWFDLNIDLSLALGREKRFFRPRIRVQTRIFSAFFCLVKSRFYSVPKKKERLPFTVCFCPLCYFSSSSVQFKRRFNAPFADH